MTDYATADASSQLADPAPERTPMIEDDVQSSAKAMIEDAEAFIDGELAPIQQRATEYYQGRPFGNEEDGRSKVVLTEQRDVVGAIMPSMMRAFFGPERVVEFLPNSADPKEIEAAEQETDYINEVVMTVDNPGFLHTYAALKDGLVRTLGVFKWYWEPAPPAIHRIDAATEEQLTLLLGEPGVELLKAEPRTEAPLGVPMTVYDVEFSRAADPSDGFARFGPLPSEEFIFSRDAKARDEALMVGHRTLRTTSDLLRDGIPKEVIEEYGGMSQKLTMSPVAIARNPAAMAVTSTATKERAGEQMGSTDRHDYYEIYPYMDVDGDGYAELRRVCLLGPGKHIVSNEPASERPFAIFVPDPEPHTMVGLSVDDYTSDLQRIMSFIYRAALDGLAATLNPRYEVVEDKVEMADVMSHELGVPIRVKEPNVVRAIGLPFDSQSALAMLEYTASIKENRIGITRGAAGLNPDALQSSSQAAVAATVEARQQRIELFARIFAETGFKQLMRGLRRLIVEHQPRARIVRLRGKYVEIDPRVWGADRDVRVNIGLGLGFADEKVKVLLAIAQDQKEFLQMGPGNPLVGFDNYRNTMARVLKLKGYPSADEFYRPLPPGYEPPPPPPPPPDPAMIVAQAEVQRTQADVQRKEAEYQLKLEEFREKQRETDLADERARLQLQADIDIRTKELELKYAATVDTARIDAELKLESERIRAEQRHAEAQIDAEASVRAAAAAKPEPSTINVQPAEVKPADIHVHPAPPAAPRKLKLKGKKNADGTIDIEGS